MSVKRKIFIEKINKICYNKITKNSDLNNNILNKKDIITYSQTLCNEQNHIINLYY